MIVFKDLSFRYKGNKTEKGDNEHIDLEIKTGEFVVLTGESGCGKTTFTRLINGLVPHYYHGDITGQLEMDGEDVFKKSISDLGRKVGSVFQNPRSQFFNVDTDSELAFAAENIAMDPDEIRERIEEVSEDLGLYGLRRRSLFELSGGEKQRIACGSVAVMHPDTVVLDEPSSNLDRESIKQLKEILSRWKNEGKTVVIAEHRLYFLKDLADRLLIIKNGRIEKDLNSGEIDALTPEDVRKLGIRPLEENENDIRELSAHVHKKWDGDELMIEDLQYSYDKKHPVLQLKDLRLPLNKTVAITGRNGIGKSTLLKCLCGIYKPEAEKIMINGNEWKRKKRIRDCYMVFQDVDHQLFTESVSDELMIGMDPKLTDKEKRGSAKSILKKFDLEDLSERHPMSLSGGQKQRVAIASAFASQRRIILMDEPTSGMDETNMLRLAAEIGELKKEGRSLFIVTHDIEFIKECCDCVIRIE